MRKNKKQKTKKVTKIKYNHIVQMPRKRKKDEDAPKLRETVVKCKLTKRLRDHRLLENIEKLVMYVSRVKHRGSLFFNMLLIHCCENDLPFPNLDSDTTYFQTFMVGIGKARKPDVTMQSFYQSVQDKLPLIEMMSYATQAVTYASNEYHTNFINSVWMNYQQRQKTHILYLLRKEGMDKKRAKKRVGVIQSAINGWLKKEVKFQGNEERFIDLYRLEYDIHEEVSDAWIKMNIGKVIRYYYKIMKEASEDEKHFSLAPIYTIKRHFFSIDVRVLQGLLKITFPDVKGIDELQKDEIFANSFNVSKLKSHASFSHMIQTDGVSMCVHFKTPLREQQSTKRQKHQHERVISVDPGRSNLVYAYEKTPDGKEKKYKVTRNQYYRETGKDNLNVLNAKWNHENKSLNDVLAKHSLKTVVLSKYIEFLNDFKGIADELWEAKTKEKRANAHFRVYTLQQKFWDRFFKRVYKEGDAKPIIAYGNASVRATARNERSVPVKYVYDEFKKRFHVEDVDEFRSTCICNCCKKDALEVVQKVEKNVEDEDGKVKKKYVNEPVRGLRYCKNTRRFLDRDLNAAKNILECFYERDKIFTRESEFRVSKGTFKLKNQGGWTTS